MAGRAHRNLLLFGFNYTFKNQQAQTYWNALTTANGGSPVQGSVYGISDNALKQAIDNFFITGSADGWLSLMIIMKMYIGATSATHAVNAINPGTFNTTFINSPTHDKTGTAYNGTTQYGNWNNNPSTDGISLTSVSNISLFINQTAFSGTNKCLLGGRDSTTQGSQLILAVAGWRWDSFNVTTGSAVSSDSTLNKVVIGSRIATNDSQIYINGSSVVTLTTSGGSIGTKSYYEGALNNNGTPLSYINGTAQFNAEATGLSSTQALSLTNAIKTLQTALGR